MKCPYRMVVIKRPVPPIAGLSHVPGLRQEIEWPECLKAECPFFENAASREGRAGIVEACGAAESRMPMFAAVPRPSIAVKKDGEI